MAKNSIKRILTVIAVTLLAVICMVVVVACGKSDRAPQKLPTPDKPEKNGGIVTWNNDPLYVDFVVSVDGVEYETSENSFDIAFAIREGETFDVKVKALGDGKYYSDSDWSETLTVAPLSLTMELITKSSTYKIKKCNVASGDIVLPQTYNGLPVTEIGGSAFRDCSDITSVTIPAGCITISTSVFLRCVNLERVIIPDTMAEILSGAFESCEKLKTISIPKSVSHISDNLGGNIFIGSGMENLTVDADNQYYRANGNCLIRKSDNAIIFANENSTIPSDVDIIAQYAIYTDKIEELTIPNGVKKLTQYFVRSDNLKRVEIPASVTEIEINAFYDSCNISEFVVSEENPVYKTDCGHIIRKSDNVLMFGVGGNIVIPDYVTGIAKRAFYCTNTQSTLFIPKSVTWIGSQCFMHCKSLEYVYLPNTLTELGTYAFYMSDGSGGKYVSGTRCITIPEGCVSDGMGTRVYSSPNCEIGYDDGYAYVYAKYYTLSVNAYDGTVNYNLNSVIHWEDYIDYGDFPYRYGYTLGGFSATPDGDPITTAEEIEQIAFTENNTTKVRVYPIWIAN
ncbi:MAG: leucine-rich repeat domain-containing protein [Clostridiales bacterium]|nr:leucine-rich repeat domain-containing protein [Clostridiales bacterium]